jgi:hypothetical protein
LLVAPSFVARLLLGEGLSSPQSLVLVRIMGAALLSIGVSCWQERNRKPSEAESIFASMLLYNLNFAQMLAALSVAGAIFLLMELNSPFTGMVQIPNAPFVDAIAHLGQ